MVAISKLAEELRHLNCNDFLHKDGCTKRSLYDLYNFLLSNMKYFAPTIFLPLLVKIKEINRHRLFDALKFYFSVVMAGTATGWSISVFMCILRNFLGEFKLYTLVYWPAVFGSLSLCLCSSRTVNLFKTSTFQMVIEIFLTKKKNVVTKAISNSTKLQTLVFMVCSSIIMEAKRNKLYTGFWLLNPTKDVQSKMKNDEELNQENAKPMCQHIGFSCFENSITDIRNYAAIGLTFDILKCIMGQISKGTKGVIQINLGKIKHFRPSTTFLFASYMAIYRFSYCFLNNCSFEVPLLNSHMLASFFSGVCFYYYPKESLLSYAITVSLDICWRYLRQPKNDHKESDVVKFMKRIPLDKILYPFCLAHVIHVYCYRPKYATNLSKAIMNGVTNSYPKHISIFTTGLEREMQKYLIN